MDVENWLKTQKRADGALLANSTKAKFRSVFSVLFNHAIRCEWLEQGKNSIALVRQSAKRRRTPEILEPNKVYALLSRLQSCFRIMVLVAATTGLRRSELFALKWSDIDFSNLHIDVQRSIFLGNAGDCKTEASRQAIPVDERAAPDLWLWKESRKYAKPDDRVFASRRTQGRRPFWPCVIMEKVIRPAAERAGLQKVIGWHTFRHSYSTLLVANDENVKVVQELMRDASSRFTLDIHAQARTAAKQQAQRRLVQMILDDGIEPAMRSNYM
jgi:integrase